MKYLVIVTMLVVYNAQALERPIAALHPSTLGVAKASEKAGAPVVTALAAPPAASSASSAARPPQYLIALPAGVPASPVIPSSGIFATQMAPVALQNSNGSHQESPSWLQDTLQSAKNAIWGSSGRELRDLLKHGDLSKLSDKDVKCIKGLQEQPTNLRSDSFKFVERISKIEQILEACRGTVINPDHFQAIITELDPAILSALILREKLVKLMNQQEELCKQKTGLHDSAGDQKSQ